MMKFFGAAKGSQLIASAAVFAALALPAMRAAAQATSTPAAQSQDVHTYRLTYTLTHFDNGKPLNTQHFAMTIVTNGRAQMKWGSKEPVMTGGVAPGSAPGASQFQFTYIDVGLSLDARLDEVGNGLRLTVKAENSAMENPANPQELKDPVVQQAVLEDSTMIKPGVPVVIGSLDVPGKTMHVEIEVKLEPVS